MRRNKRLFCILLGGVCTTAVLLVLLWPNAQDPRVRGARLSHHLRAGYAWNEVAASLEEYHQKTARQNQASIALLECGTNAFPLLTRWLRATPRELSPWVVKLLERSGSFGEPMLADRRAIALNALLQNPTLLERGQPLIRPLAHCLTNDGARAPSLAALNILLAFATPAPEEIESIQRNARANLSPHAHRRHYTEADLWEQNIGGSEGLVLLAAASEEYRAYRRLSLGSAPTRIAAAEFLAERKTRPELVIPKMAQAMSPQLREAFERAIAKYGSNAVHAAPRLESMLAHPIPEVRERASNAMMIVRAQPNQ